MQRALRNHLSFLVLFLITSIDALWITIMNGTLKNNALAWVVIINCNTPPYKITVKNPLRIIHSTG